MGKCRNERLLKEPVEVVPLDLPLDSATLAWLAGLANGCDATAAQIVASMLRDIRVDDEKANAQLH